MDPFESGKWPTFTYSFSFGQQYILILHSYLEDEIFGKIMPKIKDTMVKDKNSFIYFWLVNYQNGNMYEFPDFSQYF